MTQDEEWQANYNEVVSFIKANHNRTPSHHRLEEHNMLSWIKQQRKLIKAGSLKPERMKRFEKLKMLFEENKRLNQWV